MWKISHSMVVKNLLDPKSLWRSYFEDLCFEILFPSFAAWTLHLLSSNSSLSTLKFLSHQIGPCFFLSPNLHSRSFALHIICHLCSLTPPLFTCDLPGQMRLQGSSHCASSLQMLCVFRPSCKKCLAGRFRKCSGKGHLQIRLLIFLVL